MMDLQCANGRIGVECRYQSSVGNQVVDATIADDFGSIGGGLF